MEQEGGPDRWRRFGGAGLRGPRKVGSGRDLKTVSGGAGWWLLAGQTRPHRKRGLVSVIQKELDSPDFANVGIVPARENRIRNCLGETKWIAHERVPESGAKTGNSPGGWKFFPACPRGFSCSGERTVGRLAREGCCLAERYCKKDARFLPSELLSASLVRGSARRSCLPHPGVRLRPLLEERAGAQGTAEAQAVVPPDSKPSSKTAAREMRRTKMSRSVPVSSTLG